MTTTAAMRNNPALYFQAITKKNKHPDGEIHGIRRDLRGPPRSSNPAFKFHCSPTCLLGILGSGYSSVRVIIYSGKRESSL